MKPNHLPRMIYYWVLLRKQPGSDCCFKKPIIEKIYSFSKKEALNIARKNSIISTILDHSKSLIPQELIITVKEGRGYNKFEGRLIQKYHPEIIKAKNQQKESSLFHEDI